MVRKACPSVRQGWWARGTGYDARLHGTHGARTAEGYLSGLERRRRSRRDLQLLAGLRVDARPGSPRTSLEGPEAQDSDAVGGLRGGTQLIKLNLVCQMLTSCTLYNIVDSSTERVAVQCPGRPNVSLRGQKFRDQTHRSPFATVVVIVAISSSNTASASFLGTPVFEAIASTSPVFPRALGLASPSDFAAARTTTLRRRAGAAETGRREARWVSIVALAGQWLVMARTVMYANYKPILMQFVCVLFLVSARRKSARHGGAHAVVECVLRATSCHRVRRPSTHMERHLTVIARRRSPVNELHARRARKHARQPGGVGGCKRVCSPEMFTASHSPRNTHPVYESPSAHRGVFIPTHAVRRCQGP